MKKTLSVLMFITIALSVFAMGSSDKKSEKSEKTVIKIGAPKAPPILPVLKMIEDKAMGENVSIDIEFWKTGNQLIAIAQKGDKDLFSFPLTAAAKLYNKGVPIQLLNVNTWGAAYFLSTDKTIKTWKDLKGKKIFVQCKSAPPDIMTKYFLKKAGLKKGDYEIVYGPKIEMANMLAMGKGDYATMIEPLATKVLIKNPKMSVVMSFEKEWQKDRKTDKRVPHAGFAISKKFAAEHRDLALKFEKEFEKALKWVLAHPEEAAELAEKKLGMKKAVILKAIPKMGLEYQNITDVKPYIQDFYQFLFDTDKTCIGGKTPDGKFYFE